MGDRKSADSREEEPIITVRRTKELSWFTASIFIVGTMAGAGVLSLPKSLSNAGWYGIGLIIGGSIFAGFGGAILANCWVIIEDHWPECRENVRDPFPVIGEKAFGTWMKHLCGLAMNINLFQSCVIFTILSSDITSRICGRILTSCQFQLVIAATLLPLSWLKSPKHFKPVGVGGTLCTVISCILVLFLLATVYKTAPSATHSEPTWDSFSLAFGTVVFAFGGISAFPTIQNDMKNKNEFTKSVALAFVILPLLYLPVAIGGYAIYGNSVKDNILDNINNGAFVTGVNILIDFHLFCAFLIYINPLNMDLEQRFGIPHDFNYKRVILRSSIVILILFTSLSVPRFGNILNLTGATILPLQTFIFPPLFYYQLCKKTNRLNSVPKIALVYFAAVIIVGFIGMVASSYVAVKDLISTNTFVPPCYVKDTEIN